MNASLSNNTPSLRLITVGGFIAFFLFGFADNLKGTTLPAILTDLNFSYSQGGAIFLGAYVGFLVATLLTGMLSDVAGNKAVILAACACLLPGLAGYGSFSAFGMLTAAMTVIGLGLGSLEVGGNLMIVDLYQQEKGRYLNLLAFFHGVGSMVAPLYAGQMLSAGLSWRRVYQFSVALALMLLIYFLLIRYPKKAAAESHRLDFKHLGKSAFTGDMLLYYLLVAAYVAAEIGIGSWLVEFLQKAKAQSVMLSSASLALFFGMITVGRLVGSFFVEKIGYLKILLGSAVASIVSVALGIFAPPALAFCLPLTGLFFSVMFPTTTAAVSDLHQENLGTILGLLFTFAGVGGMLGPWLMGLCSDWFGLTWGFSLILVYCLLMVGALLALMQRSQQAVRV